MGRIPFVDGLIYGLALAAMVAAAASRNLHADAPAAPPPVPGEASVAISPQSPFSNDVLPRVPLKPEGRYGAAFSVGDDGRWLTAAALVRDCGRVVLVVAPGRAVAARVSPTPVDALVLLTTDGGAPALPLADVTPRPADIGFLPGFPRGGPGEAALSLIGPKPIWDHRRGQAPEQAQLWARIGRTDGLSDDLAGLVGGPALDGMGRVQGVVLEQEPRRGRFYVAPLDAVRRALSAARLPITTQAEGDAVTTDNYGRAADAVRRDLRVVQLRCL